MDKMDTLVALEMDRMGTLIAFERTIRKRGWRDTIATPVATLEKWLRGRRFRT